MIMKNLFKMRICPNLEYLRLDGITMNSRLMRRMVESRVRSCGGDQHQGPPRFLEYIDFESAYLDDDVVTGGKDEPIFVKFKEHCTYQLQWLLGMGKQRWVRLEATGEMISTGCTAPQVSTLNDQVRAFSSNRLS